MLEASCMSPSVPSSVSNSVREKVLAIASKLFYYKGIRNVGIDEVVASSGVAKSTLYKYFPSKDALVLDFLQRTDDRWHQWFQESLEQHGSDSQGKILAVFDVLEECLNMPGFRGCPFVNATVELAEANHSVQQIAIAHKQKLLQCFVKLAQDANIANPEKLSYQFLLLFEGALVMGLLEGMPLAAQQAREAAMILLNAQ
jgi:AcrR family transcriptional regulator